jgi:citrate lyase subunit beta / citryl-CoA lyase
MSSSIRSMLFVPANRPDRFDKAVASGADAAIVDLEDSVPPSDKIHARNALASWLLPDRKVYVRINGTDTPWFRDDAELVQLPGVAGVVLPKAERIDEVFMIACVGAGVPVLPMIESAAGLNNAHIIAQARSVQCLVFGSIDFQLDLGMSADEEDLLPFRAQIVLASRAARIAAPIDGVSTAINDPISLKADCLRVRRLGFGGKLCIHPKQVDTINASFNPSSAELAWAHRVLEAAAHSGGGAAVVDDKMVDRPVMMRARAIIQEAGERALKNPQR